MSICRLADCAHELARVDPALGGWLAAAVRKIKNGLPPAAAFELSPSSARGERDRLLVQSAIVLRQPGESIWRVACRMAARIKGPTPRHPDIGDELLSMAGDTASLPRTPRQIAAILYDHVSEIAGLEISTPSGR